MRKVIHRPDFPLAETDAGTLRGFQDDEVYTFYGIRYGRAKRFQRAEPEKSWEGIRDAKAFGYVCPLMPQEHDPEDPMSLPNAVFEMPHRFWPQSEDCLFLNVWTKHLDKTAKRPVFVWLHGGGYGTGSSIEIPAYDGHNLSDYGDVVVVTLNHRLNCLGFLDLSSFGDKYRESGINGMTDIVLALKWVQQNISAFGGDPDNVTVAGQSGGGGKTVALLQMPEADGLYRRLISESGAFHERPGETIETNKERWQRLGRKTAEVLGLNKETIDQIDDIPYEKLALAAEKAGSELHMPVGMVLFEPSVTEGVYTGPYHLTGFREETKDIPVIAGTVFAEFSLGHAMGDRDAYSGEEREEILRKYYGEDTDRLISLFKKVYPGKNVLYALNLDTMFRPRTLRFLDARAAYTDAPVYNYQYSYFYPNMGGTAPWHCSDIPFVFRNADMESMTCTGGEDIPGIEDDFSNAWLSFMENGSPSTESLKWDPYRLEKKTRMVFDKKSAMTAEDDTELIELARKHFPMPF